MGVTTETQPILETKLVLGVAGAEHQPYRPVNLVPVTAAFISILSCSSEPSPSPSPSPGSAKVGDFRPRGLQRPGQRSEAAEGSAVPDPSRTRRRCGRATARGRPGRRQKDQDPGTGEAKGHELTMI